MTDDGNDDARVICEVVRIAERHNVDPEKLMDLVEERAVAPRDATVYDGFAIGPTTDGDGISVGISVRPGIETTDSRMVDLLSSSTRSDEDPSSGHFPVYYRSLGNAGMGARRKLHVDGDMALVQALFAELSSGKAGNIDHKSCFTLSFDIALADHWREAGRPRLVLTDSLAALLSLTRSPPILWQFLPYPAVMIEVPRRFLPLGGPSGQPAWIFLGKVGDYGMMIDGVDAFAVTARAFQNTSTSEDIAERSTDPAMAKLAVRLASNVLAFVTRHRECVTCRTPPRSRPGAPPTDDVFDVRPPADVEVTRVLRDHAAALVSARTVEGAKRVLRHVVRGHWKHQVAGPGRTERKLIFVAPYVRGDESLGRVADKILRLEGEVRK